jgi:hypothetical protein
MLTAENGWMLSPEAFVDLFKSFRSIRWSEQEMQDCFSIVDSKEDGYIGRPCSSDEEELIEFGMPLYYYWLRNETMEVLKNKFIVV